MLTIPEMIMIGGNSRNSGKTTLACSIISKFSAAHEVIGLKVTSIRPGEDDLHGTHLEEFSNDYEIFEELDTNSLKDTSKMLNAGATHVYYIRVSENFIEMAVLHFLSRYIRKQIIVCESRSLRGFIQPGLFLVMMRIPLIGVAKDVSAYLKKADKVIHFGEDLLEIKKFTDHLFFKDNKFVYS